MAFRSNPRPKFMGPSPWLQGAPPTALLPNPMQAQGAMMNQGPRQGMGFNPIVSQLALANNLLSSALPKSQPGFGGPGGRGILGSAPQHFQAGGPGMIRNMMMQGGPDPKRMRMGLGAQGIPAFNQRPRMPFTATNRPQNRIQRDQPQQLFTRDRNQLRQAVKRPGSRWEEEKGKKPKSDEKTDDEKETSESKKDGDEIAMSSGDEKTYDPSSPTSDVELKDKEANNSDAEAEASDNKDEDAQGILQVTIQKGMKGRSVCKEGEALEEWTKEHGNEAGAWDTDEPEGSTAEDGKQGTNAESSEIHTKPIEAGSSNSTVAAVKSNPETLSSELNAKKSEESTQENVDAAIVDYPASVPPYDPEKKIGWELVVPLSGLFCKLCKKFYKDEDSAEKHCQSRPHYDNYKKNLEDAANLRKLKEKRELEKKPEVKPKSILKNAPKPEEKKGVLKPTTTTLDADIDTSNKEESQTDGDEAISQEPDLNKKEDDGVDEKIEASNESEVVGDKNADKDTVKDTDEAEGAKGVVKKELRSPSKPAATVITKSPATVKKAAQRGRGRGRK